MTVYLRVRLVFLTLALVGSLGCRNNDFVYFNVPDGIPEFNQQSQSLAALRNKSGGKVDILWVIDNSGSMGEYQKAVIDNTDQFIQTFSSNTGLRWKMGLISTSVQETPYVGLSLSRRLDSSVMDPISVFKEAVGKLGTSGDPREQSFLPAKNAITNAPTFLRSDALLAVIFVTDAQEQGDESVDSFYNFLVQKKHDPKKLLLYGAFGADDLNCPSPADDRPLTYKGSRFEDLFKRVDGKTYSLCSPDFGENLAKLGRDIVQKVNHLKVYLEARPVLSTLRVSYQGKVLPPGIAEEGGAWTYDLDLNAVVLSDQLFGDSDPSEVVNVTYTADDGREFLQ